MLQWIEGFDIYPTSTDVSKKWLSATLTNSSLAPGRNGGQAFSFDDLSIITTSFVPQSTWVVGFAFNPQGISGLTNIMNIRDGSNPQIKLNFDPTTRVFTLVKDATLMGTGTRQLQTGFWYYVELKVVINQATGTLNLHVNATSDISLSALNTRSANSTVDTATNIEFRSGNGVYLLDDVYVLDGSGAVNNTFLGDMTVETVIPNGPGNSAQWTPNPPGTLNFQDVITGNGDAAFVQANTNGLKDTYDFSNLFRITSNIAGISVNVQCRKTDSGVRNIAPVVRHSGTDYLGTVVPVPDTSYLYVFQVYEQNPGTVAAWTVSDVNGDQFGVQSA
jgi:hypothetical protein